MKNKTKRRRTPAMIRFALWILINAQEHETRPNETARSIAAAARAKDLARLSGTMKCAEMMRRGL